MRVTSKPIDCVVESLSIRSIDWFGSMAFGFTVSGKWPPTRRKSWQRRFSLLFNYSIYLH
jgi:hypothetical protein